MDTDEVTDEGQPLTTKHERTRTPWARWLSTLLAVALLVLPRAADAQECRDSVDNDGDGLTDLADPDCHGSFDDREQATPAPFNSFPPRLVIVFDVSGSMARDVCGGGTSSDGSVECPGSDVSCATCCDDADGECVIDNVTGSCGNGIPDDSRIYKVKQGVNDAVAAFGEVEWALMRFTQAPANFECAASGNGNEVGGWEDTDCVGAETIVDFAPDNIATIQGWTNHTSDNGADPAQGDDYELRPDGATPLANSIDDAVTFLDAAVAADTAPAGCRPYEIIVVADGANSGSCGGNPNTSAAAAFAGGYPVRVIGFAAAGLQANLNDIADHGNDGVDDNDATAAIVSDSASLSNAIATIVQSVIRVEECNGIDDDCDIAIDEGFPVAGFDEFGAAVAADTCDNSELGVCFASGVVECNVVSPDPFDTQCSAPGGTANCPFGLACCAGGETECCNSVDDDCDGKIDEGLLNCNCSPVEFCNNLDDDCDGSVDEDDPLPGEGLACGLDGIGICTGGSLECIAGELLCTGGQGPTTEVCDFPATDEDCNGIANELAQACYDEAFTFAGPTLTQGCDPNDTTNCLGECRGGIQTCSPVAAGFGPCDTDVGPITELCNIKDDDCDGSVDEDFNLGAACTIGAGQCLASGTIVCLPDGTAGCNAPTINPGIELCNNLDDDCDGDVDETTNPPPDGLVEQNGVLGEACSTGGGVCGDGVFDCVSGAIVCVGSGMPGIEECNGIDDDCDGNIDETFTDMGADCVGDPNNPDPVLVALGDEGECEFGTLVCLNGGLVCEDYVGPAEEICDGLDNDCDGMADDFATCPNGQDLCMEGQCAFACEGGEFPCPFGFYCETLAEGDFCLADPCNDVVCDPGFVCQTGTGVCLDLCEDVVCQAGEVCGDGFCRDCFDFGCEDDELCVIDMNGVGLCEPNLCFDVTCDADEFCRDGTCIPTSCDATCLEGERCLDGNCVADPCSGVNCASNETCNPGNGECVVDVCDATACRIGEECNPSTGECIPDPCVGIVCPDGLECSTSFEGTSVCTTPAPTGALVTAGGGGGCSTSGSSPPGSAALLLLACLGLVVRRRRHRDASE